MRQNQLLQQSSSPTETQSITSRKCVICGNTYGRAAFPPQTIWCNHNDETCVFCISKYCESKLFLFRNQRLDIKCTNIRCREIVSLDDIRRVCGLELTKRFEDKLLKMTLRDIKGLTWCAGPGCSSAQIHESHHNIMVCLECQFVTCTKHGVRWHETESCEEFDQMQEREYRRVIEGREQTIKRCPQCQMGIERIGGCRVVSDFILLPCSAFITDNAINCYFRR